MAGISDPGYDWKGRRKKTPNPVKKTGQAAQRRISHEEGRSERKLHAEALHEEGPLVGGFFDDSASGFAGAPAIRTAL